MFCVMQVFSLCCLHQVVSFVIEKPSSIVFFLIKSKYKIFKERIRNANFFLYERMTAATFSRLSSSAVQDNTVHKAWKKIKNKTAIFMRALILHA